MDVDKNSVVLRGVTWNILNQTYIKDKYPHVTDRSVLEWNYRLPLIINLLLSFDADLLFLQEVELQTAEADFRLLFESYDYSIHRITKKRTSHMGNMTLWKKSIFSGKMTMLNSYGLHDLLLHNATGRFLWFSNVHLKGGTTSGLTTRLQQLASCPKVTRTKQTIDNDMSVHRCCRSIVGDFNDEIKKGGAVYDWLKSNGYRCKESPISSTVNGRSFCFDRLVSTEEANVTYPVKQQIGNCILDLNDEKTVSSTGESLIVEGEGSSKEMMIPNAAMPSDHIPIEFVMTVRPLE